MPPLKSTPLALALPGGAPAQTILVIDDSASLRQIVAMTLQGAGYSVLQAGDGQAALALLDGRKIGMAICDMNMPILNGVEFVKAAKALPAYRFLPILMLAAVSEEAKMQDAKAAGLKAWMLKPFNPATLLNAVSKLCLP